MTPEEKVFRQLRCEARAAGRGEGAATARCGSSGGSVAEKNGGSACDWAAQEL